MASNLKEILQSVSSLWEAQIKACEDARYDCFGKVVEDIERYNGSQDGNQSVSTDKVSRLQQMLDDDQGVTYVNYSQLFVDQITPYAFASVPNRLATPARQQISPELENEYPDIVATQKSQRKRDTMMADEMRSMLSWFPKVYNLAREGEIAVRDALIGRGCLWIEAIDVPGGSIPAAFADGWKNLLIDPDTEQLKDAAYIGRKRRLPAWKVAELWGEDVKNVRGNKMSSQSFSINQAVGNVDSPESDITEYYEFWSVIGLGQQLVNAPEVLQEEGPMQAALDEIGKYVHFAILPGLGHPLGMDPEKIEALSAEPMNLINAMRALLEWPLKTYGNTKNPWPLVCLDYRPRANKPWPKPVLELALPLLQFIDAIYDTLLRRGIKAGRDLILTSLELDPTIIEAIRGLDDLQIVQTGDKVRAVKDLIDFLSFPNLNKDVFEILALADRAFRELTGLDPASIGSTPRTQPRSAKQSSIQGAGMTRRPDDYADKTEAFMSELAHTEGTCARQITGPQVVSHVFGEPIIDPETGDIAKEDHLNPLYGPRVLFWVNEVHADDPWIAASELEYTVEAGSGRRRNKQLQQENAQQLYTMLSQQLFAIGTSIGDFEPFLALVQMVGDAYDMPTGPIITKVRESMARLAVTQQGDTANSPSGVAGQPAAGGMELPMAGATALPLQYMGAAGGPRRLNLSPPPGTL